MTPRPTLACALTCLIVWLCTACRPAAAAEPEIVPLWPGTPPGAQKAAEPETYDQGLVRNVHVPTAAVYLPPAEKATGAAVVIYPGGGYWLLAVDHEGEEIAEWFNSIGVAGIVVKYRHIPYRHPIPLGDAQRAVRLARFRASDWGIDPNRIGILGFSAGGHLASTVGTHFSTGDPGAADAVDRESDRPDFMILVYPVISFTAAYSHAGSRANLLGPDPDPKLVENLSNELQVTAQTPPTFLVHADDDTGVPPENSIRFYLALKKATVPAELHIYEKGGHGFGQRADRGVAAVDWPRRCTDWMRGRGLLSARK